MNTTTESTAQDLPEILKDLQKRVTRFSVVEQELINTRDSLDQELIKQKSIHKFTEKAIGIDRFSEFCNYTAESIIEIFEVEVGGFFAIDDKTGDILDWVIVDSKTDLSKIDLKSISHEIARIKSQNVFSAIIQEVSKESVWAFLLLHEVILTLCRDKQRNVVGFIIGGSSIKHRDFYNPIDSSLVPSYTIFAEQVSSLLCNLKAQKTIHQQLEQLRDSEERLSLALSGGDLGTWDWNIQSGEVLFNERWADIVGYKLSEIKPDVSLWEELIHPEDISIVKQSLTMHLEGHIPFYETRHRLRHKSGKWIWVLDKGRIISFDSNGKPLRACGTHLDITDHMQIENERQQQTMELAISEKKYKELAQNLEDRVTDQVRTIEEAQTRLFQSEKMASLGQLAAGVAHEINNPISFIMNNSIILSEYLENINLFMDYCVQEKCAGHMRQKRDELDIDFILEDIVSLLSNNNDGLKRVSEIVKNLRNFSHLDKNDSHTIANLEENILSTLKVVNNEIKYTTNVKINFSGISAVKCNAGELNQVFINLIINADQAIKSRKAETPGNLEITTYENDEYVFCDFSDDGPGIEKDLYNKIFNPFFTTKEIGQGTGLGLHISYDIIVNKHNGLITVESDVGKGTTFRVQIPKEDQQKLD